MYSLQKQAELKKEEIIRISIRVLLNGQEVLYLGASSAGEICRKGTGDLYMSDSPLHSTERRDWFETLRNWLDNRMLMYPGLYFDPKPVGMPVEYRIGFDRKKGGEVLFRFHTGMESASVRQLLLLPYFDTFVCKAVQLTDPWYRLALPERKNKGNSFFPENTDSRKRRIVHSAMGDSTPRWWQKHL